MKKGSFEEKNAFILLKGIFNIGRAQNIPKVAVCLVYFSITHLQRSQLNGQKKSTSSQCFSQQLIKRVFNNQKKSFMILLHYVCLTQVQKRREAALCKEMRPFFNRKQVSKNKKDNHFPS